MTDQMKFRAGARSFEPLNKLGHIRRVNRRLHLAIPLLITPLQLMKGEP